MVGDVFSPKGENTGGGKPPPQTVKKVVSFRDQSADWSWESPDQ